MPNVASRVSTTGNYLRNLPVRLLQPNGNRPTTPGLREHRAAPELVMLSPDDHHLLRADGAPRRVACELTQRPLSLRMAPCCLFGRKRRCALLQCLAGSPSACPYLTIADRCDHAVEKRQHLVRVVSEHHMIRVFKQGYELVGSVYATLSTGHPGQILIPKVSVTCLPSGSTRGEQFIATGCETRGGALCEERRTKVRNQRSQQGGGHRGT